MVDKVGKECIACALLVVIGMIIGAAIVLNQSTDGSSDPALQSASECTQSGGVVSADGQWCYRANAERKSWEAASTACIADGQALSVVKSSADSASIGGSFGTGTTYAWFALRRRAALSNGFGWSDTDQLTVAQENWAPGNPSNGLGANASIVCGGIGSTGKWETKDCASLQAYICEARLAQPPNAPTAVTATFSPTQPNSATLTFTAPAITGGSPITSYVYTVQPGGATGTGASSPIVVSGLTLGSTYNFSVAAVNKAGTGAYGFSANVLIEGGTPTAVTNLTVTGGATSLSVSWAAPDSLGGVGDTLLTYKLDVKQAGTSHTGFPMNTTVTSHTVTGLTNGQAYDVSVMASNVYRYGAVATATVTPASDVPGIPAFATGPTAGVQKIDFTLTPPSDGCSGCGISNYHAKLFDNSGALVAERIQGGASGADFTGVFKWLDATKSYTISVAAQNSGGVGKWSAFSAPSSAVTPTHQPAEAPTIASVVVQQTGNTQGLVTLTFSKVRTPVPPQVTPKDGECNCAGNGGFPVKSYLVSCTGGTAFSQSFDPESGGGNQTVVFSGLQAAQNYTCTVKAQTQGPSSLIAGTASAASSSFTTPTSVPGEPSGVFSLAKTTANDVIAVDVYWTAPYNGGQSITEYRVWSYSPNMSSTYQTFTPTCAEAVSCGANTFTGLSVGVSYTFKVAAVNSVGVSSLSGMTNASTPLAAVPGVVSAPATVTPGQEIITVTWTAPASNGASISNYEVVVMNSAGATQFTVNTAFNTVVLASQECGAFCIVVGTTYKVKVRATNSVGTQTNYNADSSLAAAIAGAPHPPANVTATGSADSITVTWAPHHDGGSAVTNYTVRSESGTLSQVVTTSLSSRTATFVSGIAPDQTYYFQVQACNAQGCSPFSTRSNPLFIPASDSGTLSEGAKVALATVFLATVIIVLAGTIWCYQKDKYCFDDEEHIRKASLAQGGVGASTYMNAPSTTQLATGTDGDGVTAETAPTDDQV